MAHECPDCWSICYCGGDIDDLLFTGTEEELHCKHYLKPECEGYEGGDDEDYDEEDGGALEESK